MEATPCLVKTNLVHPEGECKCFFGGPAPVFAQEENKAELHVPRTPPNSKGPQPKKRRGPKFNIRIR